MLKPNNGIIKLSHGDKLALIDRFGDVDNIDAQVLLVMSAIKQPIRRVQCHTSKVQS